VLGYFVVLLVWSIGVDLYAGVPLTDALLTASKLIPVALLAIGVLAVYAWLAHRTTVYTVTSRRVVMRYGVALPITVNLPFAVIEAANFKVHSDGTGDIPLKLTHHDRVSYFLLWPNVRTWRTAKPQPMLRCVPNAEAVAAILGTALLDAAKERGVPDEQLEIAVTVDAATHVQAQAAA